MNADLTVVVVGDETSQRRRSMDALAAQSDAPSSVLQTTWGDLEKGMASVSSEWVAILPDGAEPSPDWISLLDSHLSNPEAGCVGGRVLEFDDAAMSARWFCDEPRPAWIDWLGRIHSRLCDIPETRLVTSTAFLRLEGVAMRTEDVSLSILTGLERWTRFEMSACFRAQGLGRAVVFDSALVVCAISDVGHRLPAPGDLGAWEAYGRCEVELLRHYPRQLLAAWLTARSLLVGSRVSPGIALWPLYATAPSRNLRWRAVVRGKLRGLVGVGY